MSTPAPADLIGRAKECRALDELLDAVRDGQGRALVVRGEAGIGKSALLRHLVEGAHGFRVVRATGIESEMEMPFAALHQLCVSLLDRLDALPDPQRDAAMVAFGMAAGQPTDGLLIGLAALSLLSETASAAPLLCVIDDAQWLDRASLQTLTFVARRLLADPVAMVFATREPTRELDDFTELFVEGLREGDAQTLLSAVLHVALDERVRARIVAETHGNPLALVEWPRGRTPAELAGGFGMPSLTMSGQIEENYRRRIADLPASTRRLLTVAAAEPTGDPAIVWHAASALGVDKADALPAVDGGLLELGVRVWFRHPLVRSAAYNVASVAGRQEAHRALADATDPDLDPDRQAWHRALGAPGPDEEIADALAQSAGRARVRGGLAASAALLERSVALTLDPTRRARRIVAAASAHLDAGSFDQAAGLLAAADATSLDEMGRAQVELLRARHAMVDGDVRDAPGLLIHAAKCLEPLDLNLARTAHLHAISAASLVGNLSRYGGLREACEAAIACPWPSAPTTKDWLVVGLAQDSIEGLQAAVPALRRALESADDDAPLAEAMAYQGYHVGAALALWEFETFRERALLYVRTARELGALTRLPTALNAAAHAFVLEGDLDAAAAAVSESAQIYEATGTTLALAMVVALRAGLQGAADASTVIEGQIAKARAAGMSFSLASALWAGATLRNGLAQYEQAFVVATEAMQNSWERGGHVYYHELIEAAVRAGHPAAAAATLERLKESTEPSATDWAMGIQRRSEALLADNTTAEALYREAIARLGRTPVRTELARAHLLFGEWLRRENRRVVAREQLRCAHELFIAMGIYGFAERTRRELAATGETVRKRNADSFDELTPQEAHIARLAADGCTNPEIGAQLFISPRTVEWHLRKIFTKLGIRSRRELRNSLRAGARAPA